MLWLTLTVYVAPFAPVKVRVVEPGGASSKLGGAPPAALWGRGWFKLAWGGKGEGGSHTACMGSGFEEASV